MHEIDVRSYRFRQHHRRMDCRLDPRQVSRLPVDRSNTTASGRCNPRHLYGLRRWTSDLVAVHRCSQRAPQHRFDMGHRFGRSTCQAVGSPCPQHLGRPRPEIERRLFELVFFICLLQFWYFKRYFTDHSVGCQGFGLFTRVRSINQMVIVDIMHRVACRAYFLIHLPSAAHAAKNSPNSVRIGSEQLLRIRFLLQYSASYLEWS